MIHIRRALWFVAAVLLIAGLLGVATTPAQSGLSSFVSSMSDTGIDEMCEVWSQDRQAVIDRLLVLDREATAGEAVAVAGQVCNLAAVEGSGL